MSNLEHACRREAKRKEVGIEIGELKYLGSRGRSLNAHDGVQRRGGHHRRARGGEEALQARWVTRRIHERTGFRTYGGSGQKPRSPMIEEWLGHDLP